MNTLATQANTLRTTLKGASQTELDQAAPALVALQNELGECLARTDPSQQDSVLEQLERLAVRFENDHPAAGTAIRETINALAKAGI